MDIQFFACLAFINKIFLWLRMETLPELEPSDKKSTSEERNIGKEMAVSEMLLNILSRLTVYQSLPETGSLVLAVRDDVAMVDVCCLFLPSQSGSNITYHQTVEVLATPLFGGQSLESPDSKSRRLLEFSRGFSSSDMLFSKALVKESTRVTSAIATDTSDLDPVGDFLSISDFFFFIEVLMTSSSQTINVDSETTVAAWLAIKRAAAASSLIGSSPWKDFCEKSILLKRAFLNISQGIQTNQVVTGSSMNMSSSNLLMLDAVGGPIPPRIPKSGGCTLLAVSELIDRPWQLTLPLTVSTEKGISAIFAYTSLQQLIAHAAMNCADPILEPFFSAPIEFSRVEHLILDNPVATDSIILKDSALVVDAVRVLSRSPVAILTTGSDKKFKSIVRPETLVELISTRMDDQKLLPCLTPFRDLPLLYQDQDDESDSSCLIYESDFPLNLSILLQRLLLAKGCILVALSADDVPLGTLTVRDLWSLVMSGTSS